MSNQSSKSSLIIGGVLIAIGAFFFLDKVVYIPWSIRDYLFTWQNILILVGLVVFFQDEKRTSGIILMSIGGFFLLAKVINDQFDFHLREFFWPLVLIIGGVLLIMRRRLSEEAESWSRMGQSTTEEGDLLNVTAILGGGDVSVESQNFKGGKVTCFMGGGNYDLTQSQLAPGPQVIDMFAMFGGATFIVPSDWKVRMEVTAIFGGFTDARKKNTITPTGDYSKELVIKGTVLFGGGEVKNYI